MSFDPEAAGDGYFDISIVAFDRDVFSEAREILLAEPLTVTRLDATRIEGQIDVLWDGVLYLSVPHDPGWTTRVNGEVTETVLIGDAMTGIPLSPGSYTIEMRFRPAGFLPGLGITVLAMLVIAGERFYTKKRIERMAASDNECSEETIETMETVEKENQDVS